MYDTFAHNLFGAGVLEEASNAAYQVLKNGDVNVELALVTEQRQISMLL